MIFLLLFVYQPIYAVKTLPPKPKADQATASPISPKNITYAGFPELFDYEDKSQTSKCSVKWRQQFAHVKNRFSDAALQDQCKTGATWVKQSKTLNKTLILDVNQKNWLGAIWKCKDLICLCRAVPFCNKFLVQIEAGFNRLKGMNDLSDNAKALREFINDRTGPNTIVKIKKPFASLSRSKRQSVQDLADVIQGKVGKAQRKEIRMLNNEERKAFFKGVAKLKTDMLGDKSKYDLLIIYNTPEQAPEAHFCSAFLPFHRELLKNMEVAIRQTEPAAAIPYWDTTLDEALPDPKDSVLWTDELLGNGDGAVISGPFSSFTPLSDPIVPALSNSKRIMRNVGQSPYGSLIKESDIQTILKKGSFRDMSYCVDPFVELLQGAGHLWVGGHMFEIRTSPNDPVFFMYHAFIDSIWEQWRQQKQNRTQRETDYTSDTESCNGFCTRDAEMKPFPMTNADGLQNLYTDTLYSYDLRPSCSSQSSDCGSPYLFCNTNNYKCMSKVKPNGNCTGFDSQDICYKSKCYNGKCKASEGSVVVDVATFAQTTTSSPEFESSQQMEVSTTVALSTLPPTVPATMPNIVEQTTSNALPMKTVWIPVSVIKMIGQNAQPSYPEANIISTDNVHGVKFSGIISDPTKVPFYTGAAFAQVLNPFSVADGVEAAIEVFDENNKKCVSFCYNAQTAIYELCSPKVSLSSNMLTNDDTPYTPTFENARLLNWNKNKRRPDKFMFMCYFPAETSTAPSTFVGNQSTIVVQGGSGKGTNNVKINSITDKETSQVLNGGCINMHRCCSVWSSVGECKRNPWMQIYCQKDCGVCQAGTELSADMCVDFDANCPLWKTKQQCTRNPLWMEENCKKSCDVCDRNIADLLVICGASGGAARCIDTNDKCKMWANNNECTRNPWWMKENCAVSCNSCTNNNNIFLF